MVREAATFSHYVDRLAYVDVGTGRTGTIRFARGVISNLLQHTIRVPPCVELVPPLCSETMSTLRPLPHYDHQA